MLLGAKYSGDPGLPFAASGPDVNCIMRNICKQLQMLNAHTNRITSKGALRSITRIDKVC